LILNRDLVSTDRRLADKPVPPRPKERPGWDRTGNFGSTGFTEPGGAMNMQSAPDSCLRGGRRSLSGAASAAMCRTLKWITTLCRTRWTAQPRQYRLDGESYKQVVKLILLSWSPPQKLFNSSLEGNVQRAIATSAKGRRSTKLPSSNSPAPRWRLTLQRSLNGRP
jgi:hypothetical protein